MEILNGLLPLIKLGALGAGAGLLFHLLGTLGRRSVFSPDMLALLTDVIRKVVLAVEQAHGNLAGPDKKRLAEEMIGEILSHLGINAPRALIEASIESAVMLVNAIVHNVAPVPAPDSNSSDPSPTPTEGDA